jgi:hypothetical protein
LTGSLTDEELLERHLPQAMEQYFVKKLPDLDRDELRVRIAECIKGLILMSRGNILFSDEIDSIWHYWILQTEQYDELCANLPEGHFRHHSSNDYPDAEQKAADTVGENDRVIGFFVSYVRNFGPIEPSRVRYWPPLAALMRALGWGLPQMNAFLQEQLLQLEITLQQLGTWSTSGDTTYLPGAQQVVSGADCKAEP